MIQNNQGVVISLPEEIAYKHGWISKDGMIESTERYGKSPYGAHLQNIANGKLIYSEEKELTIFVTRGARLIGSNFIFYMLDKYLDD